MTFHDREMARARREYIERLRSKAKPGNRASIQFQHMTGEDGDYSEIDTGNGPKE